MKNHLKKGIEKISKKLDLEFSFTVAEYNFELGIPLENVLKSFFEQYFPNRYKFGSGYLVDINENVSNQCDWIIYDPQYYAPLIGKANSQDSIEYYPFDSVYSVIEVKRTLNKESFEKAIKQIKKTQRLRRSNSSPAQITPLLDFNTALTTDLSSIWSNCLVTGIYAYTSDLNERQIIDILKEVGGYKLLPDLIAIHGKFYLTKTQNYESPSIKNSFRTSHLPQQFNSFSVIKSESNTAGVFYTRLLNQLNNIFLSSFDYRKAIDEITLENELLDSFLYPNESISKYEKEIK
ncbi:MAG: hypothetical protein LKG19_00965 [Saprospiraceae bacterium]|jgi:hypothetical protein|nr:hypothetical protein [Saprospiraceae bacterium]